MPVSLPLDCVADYYAGFLSPQEGTELFDDLCSRVDFSNRIIHLEDGIPFEMETGRIIYLDEDLTGYDKLPKLWGARQAWPPMMQALKDKVEAVTRQTFHVCPCLYYPDGRSGADFHSDFPAYGDTTWIASVSLGEEREFVMRHRDHHEDRHSVILEHGSLIVMGPHCQERYEHAVPRDPKYVKPRINLTFRKFGWE